MISWCLIETSAFWFHSMFDISYNLTRKQQSSFSRKLISFSPLSCPLARPLAFTLFLIQFAQRKCKKPTIGSVITQYSDKKIAMHEEQHCKLCQVIYFLFQLGSIEFFCGKKDTFCVLIIFVSIEICVLGQQFMNRERQLGTNVDNERCYGNGNGNVMVTLFTIGSWYIYIN